VKALPALLILCAAAWVVPPAAAQSSNTIVRFHFYRGSTAIGDLDVEMFDYEKPVTVSNFLRYVRNGGYHNLVLNRCIPGFVIQAGALWSPKPLSSSLFFPDLRLTPNYGPITNEFSVGQQWSNVFGTIAMARVGGETNSASSEFFFNLGNNSTNLDNFDGGFTVFGRVVTNPHVLDYFNHPSPTLNILHLGGYYADLPVATASRPCTTLGNCPRSLDLYHMKISIHPPPSGKPPTVTLTYPTPNVTVTSNPLTVTGTAAGELPISSIFYSLGLLYTVEPNLFTNAPGGTNWFFTADIPPGTNYLELSSVDSAGQRSTYVARTFFHSVPEPLSLTITGSGSGTVIGATNGQPLEIGRYHILTARPARGHLFGGWTGSVFLFRGLSPGATRHYLTTDRFFMYSNATLTATFVTNPFAPMKGTYSGLFYNTNVPFQPGGLLTFAVTDSGKVSGKLNVLGKSLPFSGALTPYGEARIRINAASVASRYAAGKDWFAVFSIDVTNKSDQVFASEASGTGYPYIWDGLTFNSALNATRVRVGTKTDRSRFEGKYTLGFPGSSNATAQPGGTSYGAATVSYTGAGKVVGSLADGTAFTASAPVTTNGLWPLYAGLYSARGWLSGWTRFDLNNPTNNLHGSMRWRKLAFPGKPYPLGFEVFPTLFGSTYTTATATNRVLTFSDGVVALTGPNLFTPLANEVVLNVNNTVVNRPPATNKFTFSIVKSSGLFSGTVKPTNETRTISFKGALFPKQDFGAGYYLSTNLSGQVHFGE